MAEEKKKPTPFFTTEKVTLFAPKGAKHYKAGEKVEVQARQKQKFLDFGFCETEDEAKQTDAHDAIAAAAPAKAKKSKTPAQEPKDPE